MLYCTLNASEFNRISTCTSAKKIWDRLKVTHEGTNQVKESKINMLVHKYELFQMEQNETITSMFTRFTDIINYLKSLCRVHNNSDVVIKILRSLPRAWEAKVMIVQEAKDLSTLPLEELQGSLMTHELMMQQKTEDESKKKKVIALKATTSIEREDEEESDSGEEKSDNKVALLTRKFKKFLKRRGPPNKGRPFFKRNQLRGKKKRKSEKI